MGDFLQKRNHETEVDRREVIVTAMGAVHVGQGWLVDMVDVEKRQRMMSAVTNQAAGCVVLGFIVNPMRFFTAGNVDMQNGKCGPCDVGLDYGKCSASRQKEYPSGTKIIISTNCNPGFEFQFDFFE